MFYIKTITIDNASPEVIEKAIRHYTKIRNSYLDFLFTAGEFHDDKVFAGLEKNNRLLITRMKDQPAHPFFENYRPRRYRNAPTVFVSFKKETGFSSYQIRLGFFSMVLFCMISFWFVFGVWQLLNNHFEIELLFGALFFFIVFLFVTNREINTTKELINKVIQSTRHNDLQSK